jgi:hypothetical protein
MMAGRYVGRAATRLRVVSNSWFDNRPDRPTWFDQEIRQYLLEGRQQWLFYSVWLEEGFISVHTVWGARRGDGPAC